MQLDLVEGPTATQQQAMTDDEIDALVQNLNFALQLV